MFSTGPTTGFPGKEVPSAIFVNTWGIIPMTRAAGRLRPLAYPTELLPVGTRFDGDVPRPRAVGEYLLERMVAGGATRICIVVPAGRSDLLDYYGGRSGDAEIVYAVQPEPAGYCDALFRGTAVIGPEDRVLTGRPRTIWFPEEGYNLLPDDVLSFLLFPSAQAEGAETVVTDEDGGVREIDLQRAQPGSSWIWSAVKLPGRSFHALHQLWIRRGRCDDELGPLINAYLACGGRAVGVRSGLACVDVGTLNGYREALQLLAGRGSAPTSPPLPESRSYTDGWQPLTAGDYARHFPGQRLGAEALHRSNR